MSAIRTLILLAMAGGATAWYQNNKYKTELQDLETQRQDLTARLKDVSQKIPGITEEVEALEKKWDATQNLKIAGEEVFALEEEADKLRAAWREKRDAFLQKLGTARTQAQGMKVASIRLKSGQELKNCTIGSLNDTQDTISISHDDGILRVAGADLTGPVADYLRMGYTVSLPPELDAPEAFADLKVEVKDVNTEPTESALPAPAKIDQLSVTELQERRARAIRRAHVLNGQLEAARKTMEMKKAAIAQIEGRYEAARMFGQTKQTSLKTQIAQANKELFDFHMRYRKAEWEKLALKRDVAIIDNKLKELEARALKAAAAKEAAKDKPPAAPAPPAPKKPEGAPLR